MHQKLLSVIVPMLNEEEVITHSYQRIRAAMEQTGYPYELVFVDDGSTDGTLAQLREIAKADRQVRVLSFSRNFGHQLAVTAGMDAAKGDAFVIIDADLQDPPELISQMVTAWENGAQIVYGKREKRKGETLMKRLTAYVYYRLLNYMSSYPIPLDTGDFRLLDRTVADVFLQMREHNRFLRGMSAWAGFKAVPVSYVREERYAGKTKYSLKKMLKLAFDGIVGFSAKPLTLPGYLGVGVTAVSLLGILAMIVTGCCGVPVAGWLWAFGGVLFLQGVILITLGVQGAYMSRIYDEVQGRPLYIVKERIETKREEV
ncbi:MAG: glycosyltransferase family 2 protein [Eubacteriales bacterium]|nr:glycosyltransferase family 2 protein [Eubacteriales bacterium]